MGIEKNATRDRIRCYLKDHPDLSQRQEGETLKLKDPAEFSERMISALKNVVQTFRETQISTEAVLLGAVTLDETIPITISIYKKAKMDGGQKVADNLFFELKKGGEQLGEFALRDYGDEFRLSHRKIYPQYRGGEVSGCAMRGIEEFVKEYSRQDPKRRPVIHASAAQLDVINWFLKNDYESTDEAFPNPHGMTKMHDLDEVLDSLEQEDGRYTVSPEDFLYVFPGDFKGPHKSGSGTTPEEINIDASALVHFKKELPVETAPEIEGAQEKTSAAIQKLGL